MTAPETDEIARRRQMARRIVLEQLRQIAEGHGVSEQQLLEQYPEVRQELAEELRKFAVINGAGAQAAEQQMAKLVEVLEESEGELAGEGGQDVPAEGPPPSIRATYVEAREPDEGDIRSTVLCDWDQIPAAFGVGPSAFRGGEAAPIGPSADGRAKAYRPRHRPPMGVLVIVDDNQATGEWVRIRGASCVIGRGDGAVQIPHEMLMSHRHAEIRLQRNQQGFQWYLYDLGSTNGTFVLVDAVRLKESDELIIGSRRFRFTMPAAGAAVPSGGAALVHVSLRGCGERIDLGAEEVWLGRDRSCCSPLAADDPLLEMKHARIYREPDTGRWCLQNLKSLNGVWVRIAKVKLCHGCMFLLGEQRFRFLIP